MEHWICSRLCCNFRLKLEVAKWLACKYGWIILGARPWGCQWLGKNTYNGYGSARFECKQTL
jgi:hypothetical protein